MKLYERKSKGRSRVLALLLAVALLLSSQARLPGASAASVQSEIDSLKKDAAALAQQKQALNEQLAALEGEINSALSKKVVVEQKIMVINEQITTTEEVIAGYDNLIIQEEANLAAAEEQERIYFDAFCRRVRAMEEEGTVSYWEILFNAADFNDLLDRAMMIHEIAEYDNAMMAALKQARLDVEAAKAALEEARAEQVAAKEELDAQKAELDAQNTTLAELLRELEANQSQYEGQLDQLDSEMAEIDREIAAKQEELERQRAAEQIHLDTGTGYLWPVDGCYVLTSLFGPRLHPITHLPGNHLGTDIRAGYGTPIRSARGGQVVTSTYNSSYGNYVVVDHGDGVSTLYAHMSSRAVSVGQVVSQGETLGYVGSTGSSNGNHLHYEVRVNNVRMDAVDYYPNLPLWTLDSGQVVPLNH